MAHTAICKKNQNVENLRKKDECFITAFCHQQVRLILSDTKLTKNVFVYSIGFTRECV